MSGFLLRDRDDDLDGILTSCLTMLPACRATDRHTLTAGLDVLVAEETDDLGDKENGEAAGVDAADLVPGSMDMLIESESFVVDSFVPMLEKRLFRLWVPRGRWPSFSRSSCRDETRERAWYGIYCLLLSW